MCRQTMRKLSRGAYEDMKGFVRVAETLLEVVILTLAYYIAWKKGYDLEYFAYKGKYVLMGVYAVLLYALFLNSECTMFGQLHRVDLIMGQIISICLVNIITYCQLCLIGNAVLPPSPILILTAVDIVIAIVLILAYTSLYHRLYAPHDMLLIYGHRRGVELKIKMDTRKDKYNISGLISSDEGYDKIIQEIPKYDAVILNDVPAQMRNDLLKFCYRYRVRTYVAPKLTDIMLRGARNITLFDTPLLLVKGTGLTPAERVVKRTMDIFISAIVLLILALPMLLIAAAIKLEDGGPVFYRQKRLTRNGREFDILKFRSMIVDAEKYDGAVLATDNDPRITKVGKFMRPFRIDELPQLINVFLGDMAIVGPRPEVRKYVDLYSEEQRKVFQVRPGITDLASIKYRNENELLSQVDDPDTYYIDVIMPDKLAINLEYIRHQSFMGDIKIIFNTLFKIF